MRNGAAVPERLADEPGHRFRFPVLGMAGPGVFLTGRAHPPGQQEPASSWRCGSAPDGRRVGATIRRILGNRRQALPAGLVTCMVGPEFPNSRGRAGRQSAMRAKVGDAALISRARSVLNPRKLSPTATAGGVACALATTTGAIHVGVCIDAACGKRPEGPADVGQGQLPAGRGAFAGRRAGRLHDTGRSCRGDSPHRIPKNHSPTGCETARKTADCHHCGARQPGSPFPAAADRILPPGTGARVRIGGNQPVCRRWRRMASGGQGDVAESPSSSAGAPICYRKRTAPLPGKAASPLGRSGRPNGSVSRQSWSTPIGAAPKWRYGLVPAVTPAPGRQPSSPGRSPACPGQRRVPR